MRVATRSFAVALLASAACALSHTGAHEGFEIPRAVSSPAELALLTERDRAPVTIHIVNGLPHAYRVSISMDGVTRVLGSVSGFETRDFPVDQRSITGNAIGQLFVAERDGANPRDSEVFPLSGARRVTWIL